MGAATGFTGGWLATFRLSPAGWLGAIPGTVVLPSPIDMRGLSLRLNGNAVPWLVTCPSAASDRLGHATPAELLAVWLVAFVSAGVWFGGVAEFASPYSPLVASDWWRFEVIGPSGLAG